MPECKYPKQQKGLYIQENGPLSSAYISDRIKVHAGKLYLEMGATLSEITIKNIEIKIDL